MEKDLELTRPLVPAESDDETSSIDESFGPRQETQRSSLLWKIAIPILSVVLGAALFIGGILVGSYFNFESRCAAHATQYSPLLRDVKIRYREKSFDGTFHKENIFRQSPSPEVDAAWEGLGIDYRSGPISVEDGLVSGLEPDFVQRSKAHGGGFIVNVEGMHHLHCLNLVRKSLYFNHGYYEALGTDEFKNNGSMLEHHITHCLDTVRQVLMCNVDTGVLGQRWVDKEEPYGFPDFQTTHKCKNYDDIKNWAEKLQSPPFEELPMDYLAAPEPQSILSVPP